MTATRSSAVVLSGLRKQYDNGFVAVHDIDLTVAPGELVVLVGPSGCGKSTLLRMVAGLESISAGTLRIDDRVVNDVPPAERDIAMVFQSYALYPHMTVRDNMGFALKLRKRPDRDIAQRVETAAETLGITALLDRQPRQLSGGQRQRVAIGRAIVREPKVFLFDEPLSNLDAALRGEMRREIGLLHQRLGATMLYVTHDQVEAMTLGDRIVVLDKGRVRQVDTPERVYTAPADTFVAQFLGSPAMNMLSATVTRVDGRLVAHIDDVGQPVDLVLPDAMDVAGLAGRDHVFVGVRPEALHLERSIDGEGAGAESTSTSQSGVSPSRLLARVELAEVLGHEQLVHLRTGSTELVVRGSAMHRLAHGDTVAVGIDPSAVHVFDAESGRSLRAG